MTRIDEYRKSLEQCKDELDKEFGEHPIKFVMLRAMVERSEHCYRAERLCKN